MLRGYLKVNAYFFATITLASCVHGRKIPVLEYIENEIKNYKNHDIIVTEITQSDDLLFDVVDRGDAISGEIREMISCYYLEKKIETNRHKIYTPMREILITKKQPEDGEIIQFSVNFQGSTGYIIQYRGSSPSSAMVSHEVYFFSKKRSGQ